MRLFTLILLPVPSRPETGSGLLRLPCPCNCTGGDHRGLTRNTLPLSGHGEGGGGGNGTSSHSLGFFGIILKPRDQTEGHVGYGFQILFPAPNACTKVDGGSLLVILTHALFNLLFLIMS